ncbi:MAG: ABC transporter permease [Lachnospiraceae bacterium]
MNWKNQIVKIMIPILAILIAFIIGAVLILIIGGNPLVSFSYLITGAVGSPSNIASCVIKATPLIFTGLAATFAYRCGVFNLGIEGQFVMGAIAALVCSQRLASVPVPVMICLSILSGAVAGGLWGLIPGLLKIYRGLNEIIVTIMMNYIAILFMGFLYSGPLREGNVPQTAAVTAKLPAISSSSRIHIGIVIAVVLGVLIYYFLFYTALGLKLRAVGFNKTASNFNGFPVFRLMISSFLVSGAIAGLGGAVELFGSQYRLMSGFGDGYGFDGIAIALIAQLNPIGTVIIAFLFAALSTGATTMQVGTGMPTSVIDIIRAMVIVFAVAGGAFINLPKVRQFMSNRFLFKKAEEIRE